jgi:hypothetical protein
MNDRIICGECQAANVAGSKFCNNCGSKLPDSVVHICPVCQTPNPKNRYYCDRCGTRLVQDDLPKVSDEPETSETESTTSEAFSLPTRKPGDTGELDPGDLPDWLRTGTSPLSAEPTPDPGKEGTGKLPNIEELTPEKKATADLPEWLVSEHDSEPIIEPPPSITTDHYFDLLSESQIDQPISTSDEVDVEQAALPAWLAESDMGTAGRKPGESAETPEDSLSDWLSELGQSPEESLEQPSEEEEEPTPEEQTPDWLAELGPLQTDILSSPIDSDSEHSSEVSFTEEPLPDWMAELGPPDTTILSEPLAKFTGELVGPVEAEDDGIDWLSDLESEDPRILPLPADTPGEESVGLFPTSDSELPAWPGAIEALPEDKTTTDDMEGLIDGAEEPELAGIEIPQDEAAAWLADSEDVVAGDGDELLFRLDEPEPSDTDTPSERQMDIGEDLGLEETSDDDELPGWLGESGLPGEAAPVEGAAELVDESGDSPEADSTELFDWMDEPVEAVTDFRFDEEIDSLAPEDEQIPPIDMDLADRPDEPDRLVTETPSDEEILPEEQLEESILDGAGEAADWLADIDQIGVESAGGAGDFDAESDALFTGADEGLPVWLDVPEESTSEVRPEGGDDLADKEGDRDDETAADVPEWLRMPEEPSSEVAPAEDVEATELDQVPAETEEEQVPDWLSTPFTSGRETPAETATSGLGATGDLRLATGELSAWVDELGQAETGALPDVTDDSIPDPSDLSLVDEDLAGWMDELDTSDLAPEIDDSEVQVVSASEMPGITDNVPGWLAEHDPIDMVDSMAESARGEADSQEPFADDDVAVTAWLAELEVESVEDETDERDEIVTALLATDEDAAETALDWLTELEDVAVQTEQESVEDVAPVAEEQPPPPEEEFKDVSEAVLASVPDWLSELESLGRDEQVEEEPAAMRETIEETFEPLEEPQAMDAVSSQKFVIEDELEPRPVAVEDEAADATEDDWLAEEALLDELPTGDELPDWLDQLGPPVLDHTVDSQVPEEIASSDEIPEWVASLKPSHDSDSGSLLPTAIDLAALDSEALEDFTDELEEPELPDWLRGEEGRRVSGTVADDVSTAEGVASPSWFRVSEKEELDDPFALDEELDSAADSEWSNILSELPPSVAPDELLVRAEIPEWLEELKPGALTGKETDRQTSEPAVATGPLAGLRGVVDVESIISVPRSAVQVGGYLATREQQQQAALLRRLTHWERKPLILTRDPVAPASALYRVLLAALLIVVVAVGLLYFPDLLQIEPPLPNSNVLAASEIATDAAGKPVIFAVEFTPALAGELMPQAEVLLNQLEANESPIIMVSQHGAGMGIMSKLIAGRSIDNLLFIPGEAIGLRRLGTCMAREDPCSQIYGRSIDADLQEHLADASLVVVLTGERDSLVNWIEQVGAFNDVPMLAGTTQAIAPLASSYLASGQLHGLIASMNDTLAYRLEVTDATAAADHQQRLNVQHTSELVIALLLLIGAAIYGLTGVFNRKPRASSSTS